MFKVNIFKKEDVNPVLGPTRADYNDCLKQRIKELKTELKVSKKKLKTEIK